jgi:hypothetical protein
LAGRGLARGRLARGGVGAPAIAADEYSRRLKLPSIFRSAPWSFICLRTTKPLAGQPCQLLLIY